MVIWSSLKPLALCSLTRNGYISTLRYFYIGKPDVFPLVPTRFMWNKAKNYLHFYILVGIIPLSLLSFFVNIFVGPATLTEIPEGYRPDYWEYQRHPITRFIARYITHNPQQEYEKYLHMLYEEYEKIHLRRVEFEVKRCIRERVDYQMYYYKPMIGKYYRITSEAADKFKEIAGDDE